MSERKWAEYICGRLHKYLQSIDESLAADTEQSLMYAHEIYEYTLDCGSQVKDKKYKTDILIYQWIDQEKWIPRVVIETKYKSVNTHDSITYSKKSRDHKSLHPYLRYGVFLGNMPKPEVPVRLISHGLEFDFMVAWDSDKGSKSDWNRFVTVIESEIYASQKLEGILKKSVSAPSILHKGLSV
ncbi:Uncharacterised protein [Vibrio owensii]|uniref:hypothetical protein n=1 Tax=Vibrio owensii TaxID=696485 RepID=UPI0005777719|nr:hypothetical protein [Vibrio owensii]SUQ01994.1 Uncharacterised protein [Vibrio owensii]